MVCMKLVKIKPPPFPTPSSDPTEYTPMSYLIRKSHSELLYCVLLSISILNVYLLFVILLLCTSLLLLWALGIPQCVGHSLYGSTPRGPEDDSVESKHVALLSHYTLYIFSIYYCCVWLTFTPLYRWVEDVKNSSLRQWGGYPIDMSASGSPLQRSLWGAAVATTAPPHLISLPDLNI